MIPTVPLAVAFEHLTPALQTVQWTPRFIGALMWSILALSIGAIFLLFALIRKSAATSVTSLLYLTPPTTALMAWAMFGESLSPVALAGMAVSLLGIWLVAGRRG